MEKVLTWLGEQKMEIVEYQRASWEAGKVQLAQNAETISTWFEKVSNLFN